MKIIFSRKGFDSASGGFPSPILNGIPVSLPIPSGWGEPYRYSDISHPFAGPLGPIVNHTTQGAIIPSDFAHADPVLPGTWDQAVLGQSGAAAAHLVNQNVTLGDVFVFFGLFKDETGPHHRIFGMMTVERIETLSPKGGDWKTLGLKAPHPHTERKNQNKRNMLYIGTGTCAKTAKPLHRLSAGKTPSVWTIPPWLCDHGLSYHSNTDRWQGEHLHLVNRGQEFVSDVKNDPRAKAWIEKIKKSMT